VVTTVAGSGTAGFADGTGPAASFNQPWGLALDASNNLYVCDESNRAIRIVTPDSSVTSITFPATFNGVSFYAPYNIAINQTTNALYVTDFNAQLMAISNESASIIYNGTAPTTGIAVGSDGSLYMSNNSAGTILKLSADGLTVTPFASGIGAPRNIVFDKTGNMFVAGFDATKNSSAIFQVSSTGVATVLYDDPGFKGYDIATDGNGTFYEADYFGNTIRMIDPSGNITVIAGSGTAADTDGVALKASFNGPHGITVDAIGEIYVSTFNPSTGGGNKIRKVVLE
jgi:streptogramin lyase